MKKLRLSQPSNGNGKQLNQKWPESAYVSVKKLGIAQDHPFKFEFAMLYKKVLTVNDD